jgi:two-component system, chemotaxis family, chemotaxis protein CheY
MSKKLDIVVVDDSEFTRQTTAQILTDDGHNVVAQFSGAAEAIRFFYEGSADLFIIDVVMPEISGTELAKHITDNSLDSVNIIMVSSLDTENIIIESISNGAIDFIKKPFSGVDLLQSVTKVQDNINTKGL